MLWVSKAVSVKKQIEKNRLWTYSMWKNVQFCLLTDYNIAIKMKTFLPQVDFYAVYFLVQSTWINAASNARKYMM